MGEIADMMIDGFLDEQTGEFLDGKSPGYPRTREKGHYNTIGGNRRPFSNGNKRNGARKWMIKNGLKNFSQVAQTYCDEIFPNKNYSSEKKLLVCGENFNTFSKWALENKERLQKL